MNPGRPNEIAQAHYNLIKELSNCNEVFKPEYITRKTEDERRDKAAGKLLASYAEFDAEVILTVAAYALADANFHDLSRKLQRMIEEEL